MPRQSEAARHEPERHAAHAGRQRHRRLEPAGVCADHADRRGHRRQQLRPDAGGLPLKQSQFGGSVSFNYDIARSTLLNQRYVGFYNAQCCGVSFEYQAFNYPNTPASCCRKDRRFNMSFTLAGVGSFSNFFGAFGGGTY